MDARKILGAERFDQLVAAVASGTMTQEEVTALLTQAYLDAEQRGRDVNQANRAIREAISGYPSATDMQLAVTGLEKQGVSRADAFEQIASEGLAAFAGVIAEEKTLEQQRLTAQAQADYADSPEGRKATAEAIIAQQAETEKDARLARAWLKEQATALGLSDGDEALLTDAEAIRMAFTPEVNEDTYEANVAHLNAMDAEAGEQS